MKTGKFKCKAIEGSAAWTEAENENRTLQLVVGLELQDDKGGYVTQASTFLPFTDKSAFYSIERLRELGWAGKDPKDLADLSSIYKGKLADCEVREEVYQGKTSQKVEILTGPGRVKIDNPIDPKLAAARVAAMLGAGAPAAGASKSAPKDPGF